MNSAGGALAAQFAAVIGFLVYRHSKRNPPAAAAQAPRCSRSPRRRQHLPPHTGRPLNRDSPVLRRRPRTRAGRSRRQARRPHPAQPVYRFYPHHVNVCVRHGLWLGSQDLARQLDALLKHGIPAERTYADKSSPLRWTISPRHASSGGSQGAGDLAGGRARDRRWPATDRAGAAIDELSLAPTDQTVGDRPSIQFENCLIWVDFGSVREPSLVNHCRSFSHATMHLARKRILSLHASNA